MATLPCGGWIETGCLHLPIWRQPVTFLKEASVQVRREKARPGLQQQEAVRRWRPRGESSPPEQPLGDCLPVCLMSREKACWPASARKGRDPPWTATTWGLSPSLTVFTSGLQSRVLSCLHCARACSRESSEPGGKEKGWWLLDYFHFLWDPGRQKFLSWKSLEKGQPLQGLWALSVVFGMEILFRTWGYSYSYSSVGGRGFAF